MPVRPAETLTGEVAAVIWSGLAADLIVRHVLDLPPAARALALTNVAMYDAAVACWDAKYTYWTACPYPFDPEITTVLPHYGIPDYPSGHATTLGGTAEVLAYLCPREAGFPQSRAEEDAASRLWASIHFRRACEIGLRLGRTVGQAVIDRAIQDGAD